MKRSNAQGERCDGPDDREEEEVGKDPTVQPGGPPETTRATVLGRATAGPSQLWDHNLMRSTAVQLMERRYCRSINTFYVIVYDIARVTVCTSQHNPGRKRAMIKALILSFSLPSS